VSAVEQALAAVRRSGRSADRGEVVHARSSVLVRVEPGPVAVRLPGLTAAFRDAVASAAAEAELATALAQAGTLRACHDALAPLAVDREPLWLLHEARAIARSGDVIDAIDRSLAELAGVPVRPVPLWGDWEDAQLAPLEWDLACMTFSGDVDFGWSDAPLAAHVGAYDRELLEACLRARRAQGAAYRQAIERA